MSSEKLKKYELGELADITSSKRIFLSDYSKNGIPFYRSKEIIQKSLGEKPNETLYISVKRFNDIKNNYGWPKDGDLLLSAVGERAGIPYVVRNQGDFYFKDGNLIWFRNIDNKLNIDYLSYWIKSNAGKHILNSIMIGSAQKALTIIGLKKLNINLPSKVIQDHIASILSSLDDKIELNRQTNQTLESIAQALFKEWFVNFNFPGATGEMQDSELGEIPKGWRVGKLGDVYRTTSGGTPSRSKPQYFENGSIPWIKSKELNNSFITDTEEYITEAALKNSSAKLLPKHALLIAMYGATVGEIGITSIEATCNQAICAFLPDTIYPYTFLYDFLKSNKIDIISRAVGSAQQNISQELLKKINILLPTPELLKDYHKIAESLFTLIESNIIEAQTLTQLRDSLLPKLMKGEITLSETEHLTAAAL